MSYEETKRELRQLILSFLSFGQEKPVLSENGTDDNQLMVDPIDIKLMYEKHGLDKKEDSMYSLVCEVASMDWGSSAPSRSNAIMASSNKRKSDPDDQRRTKISVQQYLEVAEKLYTADAAKYIQDFDIYF